MKYRPTLVLRRALEAGRAALVHLQPDQIPAVLRPVVRSSGLTVPLEARLLQALDEFPWLREKALEQWEDAAAALTAPGPDTASALFLLRPEGWAVEWGRVVWEAGMSSGAADGERATRAATELRSELAEVKDRLKRMTRERDDLAGRSRQEQRAAAEPLRSEQQELARLRERVAAADAARERERAEAERQVAELGVALERCRSDVKKAREERARADRRLQETRSGPAWGRGGLDLARALDAVSAGAVRVLPDDVPGESGEPLSLPAGVRPDSVEAVRAVLRHPAPKHLVIDGYNVGLALAGGQAAEVRARLDPVLARLRASARPPRSVTVVYDSAIEASRVRGVAGVVVRFAPPGTSADDVIVAAAATPGTVVVSNDRAVRERSEQAGAIALWAEALVAWSRRR